jgi:hypothetical protein
MHTLDVTSKVVFPTEMPSTAWGKTHQILSLEMLVLVMSMQICSVAGKI